MDNQRQSYQHQPIAQTDSRVGPKRGIRSLTLHLAQFSELVQDNDIKQYYAK